MPALLSRLPTNNQFLPASTMGVVCLLLISSASYAQLIPLPDASIDIPEIVTDTLEIESSDAIFEVEPQADTGGLTLGLPKNVQPPVAARGSDWVGRTSFIRSHWVRLTPGGNLVGQISLLNANGGSSGAQSLEVRLYQNRALVSQAVTDGFGKFRMENVPSGVYSLIARGDNGFVAFGLHALRSRENTSQSKPSKQSKYIRMVQAVEVGETLEISTAAVPPTFREVRGILKRNFDRIRTRYVPESAYASLIREAARHKTEGWDQPEGPEEFRGLKELESKGTRLDRTRPSTALRSHDVVLEPARRGWVIRGRLFGIDPDSGRSVEVEAGGTEVTLIQNDKRVAVDTVKAEGEFDFYGIDEGIYSIVAIGEGGFGAIAFRAVRPADDGDARTNRNSSIRLVQLDPRDRDAVLGDADGLGQRGGAAAGMNVGNAAAGNGGGGLSVAMISDPAAIRDALGGGGNGGGGFAMAGGGFGAPAPAAAMMDTPLLSSPPGAGYEVIGDSVLPMGSITDFPATLPPPPSGGFIPSSNGGSVGRFGFGGGLLGIAGGAAAIIALSDDDDAGSQRLVTPFAP